MKGRATIGLPLLLLFATPACLRNNLQREGWKAGEGQNAIMNSLRPGDASVYLAFND